MRRPNILLTIADDQRGTALGSAGIEAVKTPHLDALAERGTRFNRAYHFGSPHGAVCAPSRAMLHTGQPHYQLPAEVIRHRDGPAGTPHDIPPLLGQKLQAAGYDTFATGKWHNGAATFNRSFQSGSGIFFGGMADHWFTPVHEYDPGGTYSNPSKLGIFSTELFAQRAVEFICSRSTSDRPFFCYCAFTAPHDPRTPPDEFRRLYDPTQQILPPNYRERPILQLPYASRDEELLGTPRMLAETRRVQAEYFAMITHMDHCIGRIHQALAESGQLENTIVIHTADHGLAVGQHGLMGKQNVYEHSIRVPMLLAGPGIERGKVSESLVYQHDLHPTLLEAAGISTGEQFFQSLPLSSDRSRSHLTSHFEKNQRCVTDGRYKLLELFREPRLELYDLQTDPWETRSLHESSEHRATIEQLRPHLPTGHLSA